MAKKCFQCGNDNADQTFCGMCGSPLALGDYISTKVKDQLVDTIRDRDVLEMDSSIKVFNKAWSWIKLIFGIAAALALVAGGGVLWKVSDFWSGVGKAKQSVADTASQTKQDIAGVSSQSRQDMATALSDGKTAIAAAAADAVRQSEALKTSMIRTQTEISKQTSSLQTDMAVSREQLKGASEIQPEMEQMRTELAQARIDIQAQQKILASSEDFAKGVFSAHTVDFFQIGQPPKDRYAVLMPPPGGNTTVVYQLLRSVPIPNTLQIQYSVFTQQANTYFSVGNVVIFFWGDPPGSLTLKPLSASYFPERDNKDIVHTLSEHDGRIFADDQPLPKFNQPDPDFKGNKWQPAPQAKP